MEMEDQYCMPDLRQLMNSRSHFPSIQPTPELFPSHRGMAAPPAQPYEMLMMGRHQVSDMLPRGLHHQDHQFSSDYTAAAATATTTAAISCGLVGGGSLDADLGCLGGDGGTGRWPRQETLTLLEIRSRLDPKFKEANQKGPLWDEVSRIMSEEHGYQRSGKKCREKFENLYKYYKKTKEGKAGRQDGKHYRFFRQLEALYGESTTTTTPISAATDGAAHLLGTTANPHRFISQAVNHQLLEGFHHAPKLSESLSLSNNSSELDTSSSDYDDDDAALAEDDDAAAGAGDGRSEKGKKKRNGGGGRKGSWKAKIKEFVDGQMQRLLEKQEAWLEKMLATLEQKEQERLLRDEEWRRQEAARLDREHHFWASERAWIKARDAALMEALQKLTGRGDLLLRPTASSSPDHHNNDLMDNGNNNHHHAAAADDSAAAPPDPAAASEHLGGDEWSECEVTRLIQLRTEMEGRFRQTGCPEEVLWEEIASEMGCLGYERSAPLCRDKWNDINASFLGKANTATTKKRKETSAPSSPRSCCYFPTTAESLYVGIGSGPAAGVARSPANNNGVGQDGGFRFLMGDGGESLWDNYGLKLKGSDHN